RSSKVESRSESQRKQWAAVRDVDHGPSGRRTVVDCCSWPLAGRSGDPLFERGTLLWPLARVGVGSVLSSPGARAGSCWHASRRSLWISNRPVLIALARRSRRDRRRLLCGSIRRFEPSSPTGSLNLHIATILEHPAASRLG